MSGALRVLLIVGAAITFLIVIGRVRKEMIQIEDSVFWIILAAVLVLCAIFPGIPTFFSNLFGFMSASNFVFLAVIAILLVKEFSNSAEISKLKHKVDLLAQSIALREEMADDRRSGQRGPSGRAS